MGEVTNEQLLFEFMHVVPGKRYCRTGEHFEIKGNFRFHYRTCDTCYRELINEDDE